jgi:predicted nucleotidyltransferase component of viral defense system
MKVSYPTSFDDIRPWAKANGVRAAESRLRFAQYGILRAISLSRDLSRRLVFKGGNALDFIWQPNRSTSDLDFSIDMSQGMAVIDDEETLRRLFAGALTAAGRALNIAYGMQSSRWNPPREGHNFSTFEATVAYALPDQSPLIARIRSNQAISQVIAIDLSLNEVICAERSVDVSGTHLLRTCTIEDILAEKLRALLQQPIRNRNRAQDLLDIVVCLREAPPAAIDHERVGQFLLLKAAARGVPVSVAAFRDPDLITRTQQDYDSLRATARRVFIPFDDAYSALLEFVESLSIPAE